MSALRPEDVTLCRETAMRMGGSIGDAFYDLADRIAASADGPVPPPPPRRIYWLFGHVSKIESVPSLVGFVGHGRILQRWATVTVGDQASGVDQEIRVPDLDRNIGVDESVSVRIEFRPKANGWPEKGGR